MSSFGKRLKDIRNNLGLTQSAVAREAGVVQQTYAHWESGKGTPPPESIEKLATILNTTPEWLMFGRNPNPDQATIIKIPIYHTPISAGPGTSWADQSNEPAGYFEAAIDWIRQWTKSPIKNLAIVQIDGSSMEPSINHGELVLVDFGCRRFDGDGIYVLWTVNDILQIKRVELQFGTKEYVVKTDNPKYPAFKVKGEEIEIWGKGICVVGRKLD